MPGFELIGKEEKEAVSNIFDEGGFLACQGANPMRKHYHVRELEKNCSDYFKCKHSLAVTSGTAAIKIALKAVGVKQGDEVITQAFNFIATIEAIIDCGAIPIIVDVDDSLNMDPNLLEKFITPKTKAIIPVHMLGVSVKMNEIMSIANSLNIPVVEDSCEAIGGKYADKYLGTLGDVGIFSFDQGKMIATGEGGLIMTNISDIEKSCREYHDHGHENNPNYPRGRDTRSKPGFNYRMTEIQGAIGKIQLNKLNEMLIDNKKRYKILEKNLGSTYNLREIPHFSEPNYDTFILFEDNANKREKIIHILQSEKFGTKNLPDAMEWHCSAYWDHALSHDQILNSQKTLKILNNAIAIPIWLRRSEDDYEDLSKKN